MRHSDWVRNRRKKFCSGCNQTKNRRDFYRDRDRADGLDGYCKECRKAKRKAQE